MDAASRSAALRGERARRVEQRLIAAAARRQIDGERSGDHDQRACTRQHA